MESVFIYDLKATELEEINKFCDSVDYCAAEQYIGWTPMFFKSRICYFYLYDESGIKCFCQINERFGSANIILGPVCCDKEIMVFSLNTIINHYKKKRYYFLGIQMYYKSGYDTEYIEYSLNKKYNIKYFFNSDNTQTSIEINLEKSVEEIWNSFREDHKRNIKKAIKSGVTIEISKDVSDLDTFVAICSKMCKNRKLDESDFPNSNIRDILDYLTNTNRGQILFVKDKDGVMIGGVITVFQGKTVRMYLGASDPERRDIPISHLLVHEIILRSKTAGFKYLDLWGYNHFVDPNHQVFSINRFKRGFGGYCTFFAKKMNISLIPFGYYIYIFLYGIKKIFAKLYPNTYKN